MIFSDPAFVFLFLPLALIIWLLSVIFRSQNFTLLILILLSLLFYSWTSFFNTSIFLATIVASYVGGFAVTLTNGWHRKFFLFSFVSLLLGNMAFFKYTYFFTGEHTGYVLPLAISFYSFQQIAYLVDTFKNKTAEKNFIRYTFAVSFFPQLIAGPIVRYEEVRHQLDRILKPFHNPKYLSRGLILIIVGLSKKLLISDNLSIFVDSYYGGEFGSPGSHGALLSLFISMCFYLQIYFDFSGYCDIALGSAKLFNLNFPVNFRTPYLSTNISDFWRRWHMTLSRFLRDYLYITLGGSRHGKYRTAAILMITMLLGGLWHGAAWTFVIWGGLHGLALIAYHISSSRNNAEKIPKLVALIVTQLFVYLAWILFRSGDLNTAISVYTSLIDWSTNSFNIFGRLSVLFISKSYFPFISPMAEYMGSSTIISLFMGVAFITAFVPINSRKIILIRKSKPLLSSGVLMFLSMLVSITLINIVKSNEATQPFIYFQF